ncbi:MAG: Ig-like domain-containing protein, partial [Acidobacteriota bacterium]
MVNQPFLVRALVWAASSILSLAPLAAQPVFVDVQPPDGTVVAAATVTLSGQVTGATSLVIAGQTVTLQPDGSFSEVLSLSSGSNALILVASDGTDDTQITHDIVRDQTAPTLTVTQPIGVVNTNPVTVTGTVTDPHLATVVVEGGASGPVTATVTGGSYDASVPLVSGAQTLTVRATDTVGNESTVDRAVTLDTQAPTVQITENGGVLVDGTAFNRTVTPIITSSDAHPQSVDITLNGGVYVSGTAITAEGSYSLQVTATDQAGNQTQATRAFTIDTTAPTLGTISPSDYHLQSAAQVTLSGSASGANTVLVDSVAVSFDGSAWTAGPYTLNDGETRTFSVEARDAAGNAVSVPHRIERDGTAPAITVTSPSTGSAIDVTTITVTGTAVDPHLVSVTVDGVTANLVGDTFTATSVALPIEGANDLTIVATDSAGNSDSVVLSLVRDTTAPQIAVTADGAPLVDGTTFDAVVSPVIDVTDATAVTVDATLDGAPFTSGQTVTSDGQHQLSVTATDAAGNSASTLLIFIVDALPPQIVSVTPPSGTLRGPPAEVTLTVSTAGGATGVTVNGQAATAQNATDFLAGPLTFSEGSNVFSIVVTDAGQSIQADHTIVYDSTVPVVTITDPTPAEVVGATTVTVSGSVAEPHLDRVTVGGVVATVTGNAFLALGVPLPSEGDNVITVSAEDRAGNVGDATVTVERDTTSPTVDITDPAPGSVTPNDPLAVSGTVSDANLDRVIVDGSQATVDGGTWSTQVDLEEGINTLSVRAVDRLGNDTETTFSVTLDTEAPDVQIDVPVEGLVTQAASVTVSGTVSDEPGITVKVAGLDATVNAGTFTVADVPLVAGENRLVARATDAQGNQGVHTRIVQRDDGGPTFLFAEPASGALAVQPSSVFRLVFDEPLAAPAAGAWRLETAGAVELGTGAVVEGDALVITPDAALPSETDLSLVLSATLTDLAGNALSNPQTLTYTTADVGAPDAPVVAPLPSRLCAASVTVTGTTEPDVTVRVVGGLSVAEVRAATGSYSLDVALVPEQLNRLGITATDVSGNRSPETVVDVIADCTAPEVADSDRTGDVITVTFSEAVDVASVTGSVTVSIGTGAVTGTVVTSGDTVTFTADTTLPAEGVRLEVAATVSDLAGNLLAYPYSRLFDDGLGESFFAGTVIDDATGRPLAGARVTVTATGGVALPEPLPEVTTTDDGRFLIALGAGTHDLTIARSGYTPVFRIVTTQVGLGTDVFDPRLTPAADVVSIGTAGGVVDGRPFDSASAAPGLDIPAAALGADTDIAVTALGEQALPALLPYGWSPRGAVWIDTADASLAVDGTLTVPVDAPNGSLLVLARLDLATLQWTAHADITVSAEVVSATIDRLGAWVVVEPDAGATAPPAAVLGQVLGSSTPPVGDEVIAGTIVFDPEVVLASQTARVTVGYTLSTDAAAGVPLTLDIVETLTLLDGSVRTEAPYRADLIVYRAASGLHRSVFRLQPSETAQTVPLELGTEDVVVTLYGDEGVRGDVLGPDGGAVTNDQGDTVSIPVGALAEPTAVVLRRVNASDLPIAVPSTGATDGIVELDLGGRTLAAPADLSLSMTTPPVAGAQGLLLGLVEVDGVWRWRPLVSLTATATGWSTDTIDPQDLAWPGVREGGQ